MQVIGDCERCHQVKPLNNLPEAMIDPVACTAQIVKNYMICEECQQLEIKLLFMNARSTS